MPGPAPSIGFIKNGSKQNQFEKITPKSENLLPYNKIKCTEIGCDAIFMNIGNYELHLKRHHKIELQRTSNTKNLYYYCPELKCKYNVHNNNDGKCFGNIKSLRQHYQKVHGRIYNCDNCNKKFTTPNQLKQHQLNLCGKKFTCPTCSWTYDSLEALMTHTKRKGHDFPAELKANARKRKIPLAEPLIGNKQVIRPEIEKSLISEMPKLVPIASKSMRLENCSSFIDRLVEKGTQTNLPITLTASTSTSTTTTPLTVPYDARQTNSIEVQTDEIHFPPIQEDDESIFRATIATDTSISNIERNPSNNRSETRSPWRHIQTQTDEFLAAYKNDLHELATVAMTLASTTSATKKIDSECNTATITTATANTNTYIDHILEQTSSHMYTQTCDDYFLSELCLNDIQTQTNWSSLEDLTAVEKHTESSSYITTSSSATHCALDELLVSTETQTSFTQYLLNSCAEPSTSVGTVTEACNESSCTAAFGQLYTTQHTQTCDYDALNDLFANDSGVVNNHQTTTENSNSPF